MSGGLADVSIRREGDVVIACVEGEVDLSNAREVGSALRAAVDGDVGTLVIDLTATRYLDSSALQELLELTHELFVRRQAVHLVVPEQAAVRRVVDLVGIPDAAQLHSALDDALAVARRP